MTQKGSQFGKEAIEVCKQLSPKENKTTNI